MAIRLNGIADYLQNQRQQPSPLDAAMMSRTLGKYPTPYVKADQFDGTMPSNPTYRYPGGRVVQGDVAQAFDALYGSSPSPSPSSSPSSPPSWTTGLGDRRFLPAPNARPSISPTSSPIARGGNDLNYLGFSNHYGGNNSIPGEHWLGGGFQGVDPNTGRPVYDPSGYGPTALLGGAPGGNTISPTIGGGSGGLTDFYQSPPNSGPYGGGGTNGPQGSVYGTDPNTGQSIYNVSGSPRPGFFDSKTGKFVEGLGSTALNMFVPGAGSAARAIFDAIRRHQTGSNTGTDLSGNTGPGGGRAGGPGGQSGPAWFQPGYQPPSGIQEAIARGDYTNAYGSTPSSITANRIMSSQAYGGQPNNVRGTTDEGHNNFNLGNNAMLGHMNDGTLEHVASTFDPSGLSRSPQAGLNADLLAKLSGRQLPIYVPPRPTAPPMMIQPARGG